MLLPSPRRGLLPIAIPIRGRREGSAAGKPASHRGSAPGHTTGAPNCAATPRNSDSWATSPLCRDTAVLSGPPTSAGAGKDLGFTRTGKEGKGRKGKGRRLCIQFNPELFSRYGQRRFTKLKLKCVPCRKPVKQHDPYLLSLHDSM